MKFLILKIRHAKIGLVQTGFVVQRNSYKSVQLFMGHYVFKLLV